MPEPVVNVRSKERPALHVFYLHGFASSARSTKARYFAERLRTHGVPLHCPDFNDPDFQSLTMTRMLEQLASELSHVTGGDAGRVEPGRAELSHGTVTLVGSSLGGT